MKLRILSDLHLEQDPDWNLQHFGEDAILCAGDLGSVRSRPETEALIRRCRVPFYYVLGNHDFYGGEVGEVIDYYRFLNRSIRHFHFLHNRTAQLGDYLLAGTPLWTDFALFGENTINTSMDVAGRVINDFSGRIQLRDPEASHGGVSSRELCPQDLAAWNAEARRFLMKTIAKGKPTIVMTHWCPSEETISPCYAGEPANAYFTTECRDLMGGNVVLWVHGHSHLSDDRLINGTRVIRNPKGYPRERSAWREDLIITLGAQNPPSKQPGGARPSAVGSAKKAKRS